MEGGGAPSNPGTPEEVFKDYRGRRAGLVKALTTEVEKFYLLCNPEMENLCLYGFPNGTWEVNMPLKLLPPDFPEPSLGINFARDGMDEKDWLLLVASHSDAWLFAVAFYLGARYEFDKEARMTLFTMINNLPSIFELLTESSIKLPKEKTPSSLSRTNKPSSTTGSKSPPRQYIESGNEEDDKCSEQESSICGICRKLYVENEFWIFCDFCERWFHGKCVRVTPARAEHIKKYECPECRDKRARI